MRRLRNPGLSIMWLELDNFSRFLSSVEYGTDSKESFVGKNQKFIHEKEGMIVLREWVESITHKKEIKK